MSINKKNSDGSHSQVAGMPYVTKDNLGIEKVENKSSEDIRGEITSKNIKDALGYTPANDVDEKKSQNDIAVLASRMDGFTKLGEGSTTGDAELEDIRVAYDGKTYSNAGTAVRSQVSELKETIDANVSDLNESISELSDTLIIETTNVIRENTEKHDSGLNTAYVWMPIDKRYPKNYDFLLTIQSNSNGVLHFILFSPNGDGTLNARKDESLVCHVGENKFKVNGIDYDCYIGFYSEDKSIAYSSVGDTQPLRRCLYSDISDRTEMTGSYALNFSYSLTISKKVAKSDRRIIIVDASGNGNYTNLLTAIETEPENSVIVLKPGIYDCDMDYCLKKYIVLIGTDRNQCIIRNMDGRYGHHPLYVSCGYFENLTVESKYISGISNEIGISDLGSYAVHIDTDGDYAVGKSLEFHHCTISSDFFPAVGLGLRKDCKYIFDDCTLINNQINGRGRYSDEGSLGALYFHNTNGIKGNQYITVKNCIIRSNLGYTITPFQTDSATEEDSVHCEFVNNVIKSNENGYVNNIWMRGDPFNTMTGRFTIDLGYGNSNVLLNE